MRKSFPRRARGRVGTGSVRGLSRPAGRQVDVLDEVKCELHVLGGNLLGGRGTGVMEPLGQGRAHGDHGARGFPGSGRAESSRADRLLDLVVHQLLLLSPAIGYAGKKATFCWAVLRALGS